MWGMWEFFIKCGQNFGNVGNVGNVGPLGTLRTVQGKELPPSCLHRIQIQP